MQKQQGKIAPVQDLVDCDILLLFLLPVLKIQSKDYAETNLLHLVCGNGKRLGQSY